MAVDPEKVAQVANAFEGDEESLHALAALIETAMDAVQVEHLDDDEVSALLIKLGFDYYGNRSLLAHK